jgi:hypothetical protein
MDLLSNQSLLPFLSSFDGGNQGLAWELKEQQWRRERRALVCSVMVLCEEEEVVTVVADLKGINTSWVPTVGYGWHCHPSQNSEV